VNIRRLAVSTLGACLILVGCLACSAESTHSGAVSDDRPVATVGAGSTEPVTTSPVGTSTAPGSPTASSSGAATTTKPSATATSQTPSAGAKLAGRIHPDTAYHGVATAYAAGRGEGACLYDPSDDTMIAAMNETDYESGKACGAYILIHAANGASITVRIVNECPLPCAPGQIDLSQAAFAKLAPLQTGRLPITWTLVSPASNDTISIRYKSGSSRWWCGIQVIGHRNPVALLEVRVGNAWRQLPRTAYNYFLAADGSGCGGSIRITDIYGQQLLIDGITLTPDVAQRTSVQFARR